MKGSGGMRFKQAIYATNRTPLARSLFPMRRKLRGAALLHDDAPHHNLEPDNLNPEPDS